jgi:hypothetical protein
MLSAVCITTILSSFIKPLLPLGHFQNPHPLIRRLTVTILLENLLYLNVQVLSWLSSKALRIVLHSGIPTRTNLPGLLAYTFGNKLCADEVRYRARVGTEEAKVGSMRMLGK